MVEKTNIDDIIGLVKTEEKTDSVELKKEYYKSRMTENKRYTTDNGSNEDVCLVDNVTGKEFESDFDEIVDLLNEQDAEIKRLKKENRGLQFKIIDMLDFVKEKGTVTREEIKNWWNGDAK